MTRGLRVVALACLASCGPIAYVHQVPMTADDAVDQARAAHADTKSPYWWTRAITYQRMAREVAGHADYQGANRFGRLATEAAQQAKAEAEAGGATPPPPGVAPAKDTDAPAKDGVAPAKD